MSTTPITALATVHPLTPRTPSRVPRTADTTAFAPNSGQPMWLAITNSEKWALAHLRGWDHPGPVCPLCTGGGVA